MRVKIIIAILFYSSCSMVFSQQSDTEEKKDIRYNFNKAGTRYFKFTFTNQVWIRYNESNPGTILHDLPKPHTFDIGLRRLRLQLIGQVHEKFLIYAQFGINNFSPISQRKDRKSVV